MDEPERGSEHGDPATGEDSPATGEDSHGAGLSRREVLVGGAGAAAGAAAATTITALLLDDEDSDDGGPPASNIDQRSLQALTAAEAVTLAAMVSRLVPSDEAGPGADEATVWRYIDRTLASVSPELRPVYGAGLAAVQGYAQRADEAAFEELPPERQDEILAAMETGEAKGYAGDSVSFFNLVHAHTMQGMFGDPAHGGNSDFIGWELMDYPGIKLQYSPAEQDIGVDVEPARESTYEFSNFGFPEEG